jgi:hypothetical protein
MREANDETHHHQSWLHGRLKGAQDEPNYKQTGEVGSCRWDDDGKRQTQGMSTYSASSGSLTGSMAEDYARGKRGQ